jgi:hypothetical protein
VGRAVHPYTLIRDIVIGINVFGDVLATLADLETARV